VRLLGLDRAGWIEGLVAEASQIRADRARVAWLLGGVWLIAEELLRRTAIRGADVVAATESWCGSHGPEVCLITPWGRGINRSCSRCFS
jgi:hypothetical protein